MPSGVSKVQVFNAALDLIEEAPITSPDDNRDVAEWLNRNFDIERDYLVRAYEFNFAKKRASLAMLTDKPAFGWKYQYAIPPDCVRVLPLTVDGDMNGGPIAHEIEGTVILCDCKAPLPIRYLRRVENTADFDNMFVQLLAARLAQKMSQAFTGKNSYYDRMNLLFREISEAAERVDAQEGTLPDPIMNEYLVVR